MLISDARAVSVPRAKMTPETLFLQHLDDRKDTEGCLKFSTVSNDFPISCFIYFKYGKVVYASNSLAPFERLDRHLKRLSHDLPQLSLALRTEVLHRFKEWKGAVHADFAAILWLLEERYLDHSFASRLIARLLEEVIGTQLLLLNNCTVEVIPQESVPNICSFEPSSLIQTMNKRLAAWQSLGSVIASPYQRLFLSFNAKGEVSEKLSTILRGFNFRQLSAIHNQDDIVIARRLFPLIQKGSIILRPPHSPFHSLPDTCPVGVSPSLLTNAIATFDTGDLASTGCATKTWKVVCIDDSEAMLMEIKRFLADESLEVSTINDPKRAMLKINSVKPDLILMDVGMPHINGYQLCAMLRKSSTLKSIPIVMVTGNKGIIDRTRARMVGATDYLTKPFTEEELTNIVFRYLS